MTKKVKEVADLLEENGWSLVRIKGDHRIFKKDGARRPIVLPGNPNDDLAAGTLKRRGSDRVPPPLGKRRES